MRLRAGNVAGHDTLLQSDVFLVERELCDELLPTRSACTMTNIFFAGGFSSKQDIPDQPRELDNPSVLSLSKSTPCL